MNKKWLLGILILGLGIGMPVQADPFVWVGTGDTPGTPAVDWNQGTNWDGSVVPPSSFSSFVTIGNGYLAEAKLATNVGQLIVNGNSELLISGGSDNWMTVNISGGGQGIAIASPGGSTLTVGPSSGFRAYGRIGLGGRNLISGGIGSAGIGTLNLSGPTSDVGGGDYTGTYFALQDQLLMVGGYDGGYGIINQSGGTINCVGNSSIYMAYQQSASGGRADWNMSGGQVLGMKLYAGNANGSTVNINISGDAEMHASYIQLGRGWQGLEQCNTVIQSGTSLVSCTGNVMMAERKDSVTPYTIQDNATLEVGGKLSVGNYSDNVSGGIFYERNGRATLEIIGDGPTVTVGGDYFQNPTSTLKVVLDKTNGITPILVNNTATFMESAKLDVSLLGGGSLAGTQQFDIMNAYWIDDRGLEKTGDFTCCWDFEIVYEGGSDILRVTWKGGCESCSPPYVPSVTHWDFNGNLDATTGPGIMEYLDGAEGATSQQTGFGSPGDFGISDAELETVGNVMSWPDCAPSMGYKVTHKSGPTPNYNKLLAYSLLFDVYVPQAENQAAVNPRVALYEGGNIWVRPDSNDILAGSTAYSAPLDQWHRFVVTYDATALDDANQPITRISVYKDGYRVGTQTNAAGGESSPYALPTVNGSFFNLFTSALTEEDQSGLGYAGAVEFYNYALTESEVAAKGSLSSFCAQQLPQDLNGDCMVNLNDLAELLQGWLGCGVYPPSACE